MLIYPERQNAIMLTKANGVWADYTNIIEIIPKNTILCSILVRNINIVEANTVGEYNIRIYYGDIGKERHVSTLSFAVTSKKDTQIISDGNIASLEGERISMALTGNMINTASIKVILGFDLFCNTKL